MSKKHFTMAGRISDIIAMAILYKTYFTLEEIMEDYEITLATAYRTIHFLKMVEYIQITMNDERKWVIKLKENFPKKQMDKLDNLKKMVEMNFGGNP